MPLEQTKIITGVSRHRFCADGDGVIKLAAFIRCTVLFCIAITLFAGCTYRSDTITDNGVWLPVEDGESVEGYTNINGHIYWGYIVGDFICDEIDVDFESFQVCTGTEYAKDKRYVYYPQNTIFYDGIDDDGNGFGGNYAEKMILKGARPERFRYLGGGYAVSGNRMYLNGDAIEWNDSIIRIYSNHSCDDNKLTVQKIEGIFPNFWKYDYDSLRANDSRITTVYPVAPDSLIYLRRYYENGKLLSEGWCLHDWNRETFESDFIGIWKYYTEDGSIIQKQYPIHHESYR